MRLSALLAALSPAPASRSAGDDPIVRGISYDSRAVAAGDVFVALRGSLVDGHAYLAQAIALGAVAIVVEEIPSGLDLRGRPAIVVADTRRALAALATRFYGEPSARARADRRHRHQRQDQHHLPDRIDPGVAPGAASG